MLPPAALYVPGSLSHTPYNSPPSSDLVAAFHALTAAIDAGTITVAKTNVSSAARAARDGAADSGVVWGPSVAAAFGQSLKAFGGAARVVALPTESELAASAAFEVLPWDAEEDLSASFSDTSIRTPSPTGSENGAIPSSLKRLRHLQLEGGEKAGGAEAGGAEAGGAEAGGTEAGGAADDEKEEEGVDDTGLAAGTPNYMCVGDDDIIVCRGMVDLPPVQVAEQKLIDRAVEKAGGEGKADGASPAAIPAMLCPPATMLADHDTFVLDCDGVIWHGEDLIPGARRLIDRLRATGKVRAVLGIGLRQSFSVMRPCITLRLLSVITTGQVSQTNVSLFHFSLCFHGALIESPIRHQQQRARE